MSKDRLEKLRSEIKNEKVSAILVSQSENRFYLSGFDGSDGYLLITGEDNIVATDFRYIEQVKRQSPDYSVFEMKGKMSDWFPKLVEGKGIDKLGFESGDASFAWYSQLSGIINDRELSMELVPLRNCVEKLRAIKEPEEIACIKKAAEISDRVINQVVGNIKAGMTEKEIAWELEKQMRESASQKLPFEIIVAAGKNSALPHAQPSDRPVQEGEPIIIDMGARFGGYCSDLSRTICLGEPDDTFRKIYGIVQRAQEAAINGIRAGISGLDADSLARNVIRDAGYSDMFGHGLGHGVGLVVHDSIPRLSYLSDDVLSDGMVFSIEPGIYLPDWGGVRIEDLAVLENGVVKLLSNAEKIYIK